MEQVVYVDILIALNIIINYFLLLATAKISKTTPHRIRLLLSSVAGALFSLIIFLPEINFLLLSLVKIIFSAVIVTLAFGYKNLLTFAKKIALFYCANFIFAGGVIALWLFFAPKGLVLNNSVVYFNIRADVLVMLTAIIYAFVVIVAKITEKIFPKSSVYNLKIKLKEKQTKLIAYLDSGNTLRDVFTDKPVIICKTEKIAELFDDNIKDVLKSNLPILEKYQAVMCADMRFKIIPFTTVGGEGALLAFSPDDVEISSLDVNINNANVLIALSTDGFFAGEYDGLLNPFAMKI